LRHHQISLAKANKKRYNHPAIGVLGPSSAAQAAENIWSLKTSKFSRRSATIKSALAVNQRVKSAIATAPKIERDSRSKKREKRSSTARSPSGRMAICRLFAINPAKGGGGGQKFTRKSTFFSRILADACPMFQGPVIGAKLQVALPHPYD
jgi:hypothetical protein